MKSKPLYEYCHNCALYLIHTHTKQLTVHVEITVNALIVERAAVAYRVALAVTPRNALVALTATVDQTAGALTVEQLQPRRVHVERPVLA